MSKIKLTGSNSGYVEIASAADAGNLTLTLPTSGTAILGNAGNVFSGITTTGQLDINGSIDVSSTSVFNDDLTLTGASYNVLWDKSDNQLEFGDNAKLSFGTDADFQVSHNNTHAIVRNSTGRLYILADDIWIKDGNDGDIHARFLHDDACELRFDNDIKLETTNTGVTVTGIVAATSFSGSGEGLTRTTPLSHRNRIINGDMQVNQRVGGTETTITNGTLHYVIDRYAMYESTSGSATVTQVTSGYAASHTGSGKAMRIKTTGADTSLGGSAQLMFFQYIEGYNWEDLRFGTANAKSFTVSFSILASGASAGNVTGTYCVNATNAPNFNRTYVKEYTIDAIDTWKRVSLTFPGDTSGSWGTGNGAAIRIGWSFAGPNSQEGAADTWHSSYKGSTSNQKNGMANVNNFYFITDIQVEEGTVATPFERRNYAEELARCQRYFYRVSTTASGTGQYKHLGTMQYYSGNNPYGKMLDLPVPMRTIPTGSFTGDIRPWTAGGSPNGSFTTINFDRNDNLFLGSNGSTTNQNSGSAGNATPITLWTSSSMTADAEL